MISKTGVMEGIRSRRAVECELKSSALASRHCERSEAIQSAAAERFWIASLRSQ
jgi:hypothetical protein